MYFRTDAGPNALSDFQNTEVQCDYTGHCFWNSYGFLNLIHSFKVIKFPFDEQNVEFVFGSWAHQNDKINLVMYDPPFLV